MVHANPRCSDIKIHEQFEFEKCVMDITFFIDLPKYGHMVQIFATLVLTSTIIKWKKKLGTAL
jgi:hypothetical protein